jgi:methylated-DNA-[protein]-cysteine S-methyltransferase
MSKQDSIDALERSLRAGPAPTGEEVDALSERLAERAAADGLVDVAYAMTDTPVGRMLVATTPRGLVRVGLPRKTYDDVLEELSREVSPRVLESPARLDPVRRELEEYFEGRRRDFDLPLDWRLSHGFRGEALKALLAVPYGHTVTYTELAERAGSPRAYRAAGSACGSNPIPIVVPCHRVVRTGGALGEYGGGPEMKRFLLGLEGAISKE